MNNKSKSARENVLQMLLERQGAEVSGEEMSNSIGISRAGVAKHIKNLRLKGFDIKAKTGGGYTLGDIPNIVNKELVKAYSSVDADVKVLETTKSTNIDAKAWAEDNAPHGALVLAKIQTSGRGRKVRHWQSVEGGIWSTTILRPKVAPRDVQPVTLAAAVAVTKAIKDNCPGANPLIKWPNDILIDGRKVCGILTEFVGDMDEVRYLVVGIGINANFSLNKLEGELIYKATTLKDEGLIINSSKLIADVRDNLLCLMDEWEKVGNTHHIIKYYRDNMAFKGENISITGVGNDVTGTLQGIDDNGELIILADGVQKRIISGEISVRRV